MDRYTGMPANGTLLPNPLGSSCLEMESSNADLHGDYDGGYDRDSDQFRESNRDGLELVLNGDMDALYQYDDCAEGETSRPKKKKYRGPRSWKGKWQELYPWAFVRIVNGEERMFCTVCEAHGNTSTRNAFRKDGSSNFQPSALSTHAHSSAHKNALLMQKTWPGVGQLTYHSCVIANQTEPKKMPVAGKGKVPAETECSVVASHLANMTSKLGSAVTRVELDALKTEWRIMERCEDARRINSCCDLTDPLMPVPTLDGDIPENFPTSLAEFITLPDENIEALLMAYCLPSHGTADAKLRRLKAHLGF